MFSSFLILSIQQDFNLVLRLIYVVHFVSLSRQVDELKVYHCES